MSILQLELSEETVRQLEARAAARDLDLQSWMREQIETILLEEEAETSQEMASPHLAQKMAEALASGEPITPDDQWWADLERRAVELRDKQKA